MGSAALDQHRPAVVQVTATVLVADTDQFVRAGIRVLLEEHGFTVCAEAGTAAEAIAGATARRPDVCLLDQDLAGGSLAATREISERLPATAIVILGVSVERDGVLDALRAGAQGYLIKSVDGSALPQALRSAVSGEAVISRRLVTMLVGALGEHGEFDAALADGRVVQLIAREWDVARLLRQEMSTTQMSGVLGIAPVTVRRHVSTLLRKLGAADRATAVELLAR